MFLLDNYVAPVDYTSVSYHLDLGTKRPARTDKHWNELSNQYVNAKAGGCLIEIRRCINEIATKALQGGMAKKEEGEVHVLLKGQIPEIVTRLLTCDKYISIDRQQGLADAACMLKGINKVVSFEPKTIVDMYSMLAREACAQHFFPFALEWGKKAAGISYDIAFHSKGTAHKQSREDHDKVLNLLFTISELAEKSDVYPVRKKYGIAHEACFEILYHDCINSRHEEKVQARCKELLIKSHDQKCKIG